MSLRPQSVPAVPEQTATVARAAFPKGNRYMRMRDELGPVFADDDFADLFPRRGQPAFAPWRLALVTVFQFAENLTDRQAADAVRARLDWKYALSLDIDDPGFDFSVLSEFRARLLSGEAEGRLLGRMLELFRDRELLANGGRQRTDATHILGAVRELNRLEIVGETLHAALNVLAQVAPAWLSDRVDAGFGDAPSPVRALRRAVQRLPPAQAVRRAGRALRARRPRRDGAARRRLRPRGAGLPPRRARRRRPPSGLGPALLRRRRGGPAPVAGPEELPAVGAHGGVPVRPRRPVQPEKGDGMERLQGPSHRDVRAPPTAPHHERGDDGRDGPGRHGARRHSRRARRARAPPVGAPRRRSVPLGRPTREGPGAGRRDGRADAGRHELAGGRPRRLRRGPVHHRLGGRAGHVPDGPAELQVVTREGATREADDSGPVSQAGLRRVRGPPAVHAEREGSARPRSAPPSPARGPGRRPRAPEDSRVQGAIRSPVRRRGDDLAGRLRARDAARPLPGPGEDAPPARGDGRRGEPRRRWRTGSGRWRGSAGRPARTHT